MTLSTRSRTKASRFSFWSLLGRCTFFCHHKNTNHTPTSFRIETLKADEISFVASARTLLELFAIHPRALCVGFLFCFISIKRLLIIRFYGLPFPPPPLCCSMNTLVFWSNSFRWQFGSPTDSASKVFLRRPPPPAPTAANQHFIINLSPKRNWIYQNLSFGCDSQSIFILLFRILLRYFFVIIIKHEAASATTATTPVRAIIEAGAAVGPRGKCCAI